MRSRRASTRSKTVATRRSARQDVHITHDVEPSDDEHEQKQQDKPQVRKRNLRQRRVTSPSPAASTRSTLSSRSRSNSEEQEDNLETGKGMLLDASFDSDDKEVNGPSVQTQSMSRRSQRCAVVEEHDEVEVEVENNGMTSVMLMRASTRMPKKNEKKVMSAMMMCRHGPAIQHTQCRRLREAQWTTKSRKSIHSSTLARPASSVRTLLETSVRPTARLLTLVAH